jgi:FkbM family methyltransferase
MPVNVELIEEIAINHNQHSRATEWWKSTNNKFTQEFSAEFRNATGLINFGPAGGGIQVKNINFGSISSEHLFGLDELIIFAWYQVNKKRYRKTLDLGANIGAHSLMMSKFGFEVTAYEPDPRHAELFMETMQINSVKSVSLREKAVGIESGKMNFTRVLGNTTGSHLSGAKLNPYGELDIFEVEADSFAKVVSEKYGFIKMDVEGYEVKLISSLSAEDFRKMDIMLEIGTPENALGIFRELNRLKIYGYSQKKNWSRVSSVDDLPTSHREGSLFLTASTSMNWDS